MSKDIPDYTKDSDVDDKMIAKSSPLKNVVATDNLKFESQNETDSFTRTFTSDVTSYNGFYVVDADTGEIILELSPSGLFFVQSNGTGAGNITVAGASKLWMGGDWLPNVDATWDLGSGSYQWHNIYLVHNPIVSSDRRLKDNIRSIGYGLEAIEKLRPVQFSKHGIETLGFIAQDVHEVIPEITRNVDRPEVYASMIYEGVIPVLVKAVQELSSKVANLEEQLSKK